MVELFQLAANTVNSISKSDKNGIVQNTREFFSTLQEVTNTLSNQLNEISDDHPINNNCDEVRSNFRIECLKVEQVIEEIDSFLEYAQKYCKENELEHLLRK